MYATAPAPTDKDYADYRAKKAKAERAAGCKVVVDYDGGGHFTYCDAHNQSAPCDYALAQMYVLDGEPIPFGLPGGPASAPGIYPMPKPEQSIDPSDPWGVPCPF